MLDYNSFEKEYHHNGELFGNFQINYIADEIQMKHLRLNSRTVRQNITYHCRNSNAYKNADGKEMTFVKFMSDDQVEMHRGSHSKNQPKVLLDGCNVSVMFQFCFLGFFL